MTAALTQHPGVLAAEESRQLLMSCLMLHPGELLAAPATHWAEQRDAEQDAIGLGNRPSEWGGGGGGNGA